MIKMKIESVRNSTVSTHEASGRALVAFMFNETGVELQIIGSFRPNDITLIEALVESQVEKQLPELKPEDLFKDIERLLHDIQEDLGC